MGFMSRAAALIVLLMGIVSAGEAHAAAPDVIELACPKYAGSAGEMRVDFKDGDGKRHTQELRFDHYAFAGNMLHCFYQRKRPIERIWLGKRGSCPVKTKTPGRFHATTTSGGTRRRAKIRPFFLNGPLPLRNAGKHAQKLPDGRTRCYYMLQLRGTRVSAPMVFTRRYDGKSHRYACKRKGGDRLSCERQASKPSEGGRACPFVYTEEISSTGEVSFAKRTDLIPNLVGKAMETTYIEDIGRVVVRDGRITLRVTEEKDELSFLDYVALDINGLRLTPEPTSDFALTLGQADENYAAMERGDQRVLTFSHPGLKNLDSLPRVRLISRGFYERL